MGITAGTTHIEPASHSTVYTASAMENHKCFKPFEVYIQRVIHNIEHIDRKKIIL